MRLPRSFECDLYHAGGDILDASHVAGGKTQFRHLLQNALSSGVAAYTTDKKYRVTEPAEMGGEIEWGATQVFLPFNDIPKDFTDADYFHTRSLFRQVNSINCTCGQTSGDGHVDNPQGLSRCQCCGTLSFGRSASLRACLRQRGIGSHQAFSARLKSCPDT